MSGNDSGISTAFATGGNFADQKARVFGAFAIFKDHQTRFTPFPCDTFSKKHSFPFYSPAWP